MRAPTQQRGAQGARLQRLRRKAQGRDMRPASTSFTTQDGVQGASFPGIRGAGLRLFSQPHGSAHRIRKPDRYTWLASCRHALCLPERGGSHQANPP